MRPVQRKHDPQTHPRKSARETPALLKVSPADRADRPLETPRPRSPAARSPRIDLGRSRGMGLETTLAVGLAVGLEMGAEMNVAMNREKPRRYWKRPTRWLQSIPRPGQEPA